MIHGFYINLDRQPDRGAHMEREFSRFELEGNYKRVRAIEEANPALGCYRSHMKALEEARRVNGIAHILEDDSILSSQLAPFLQSRAPELLDQYDMLFLDMWVDQKRESVAAYQAAIDQKRAIIPFKESGVRIGAASSYLVAPHRIGRLLRRLRPLLAEGRPIDVTYDRLVRDSQFSAAVVVPFLTGVDLSLGTKSNIQSISSLDQRMFVMLRTRFFVDRARQDSL